MRTPLAWLRDYVDLPAETQKIVEKLAMLGFPVEAVDAPPVLSGIVVGRLEAVAKHPNADRLFVCTVDVGAKRPLTIATAATNVAQGQHVPVATIGAQLAGGLRIEPRSMRGVDSEGMLVSANELGLEADWFEDGILQLDPHAPPGADVVQLFRLDQDVLEVEITSNRVDAMSMLGLARELAAAFGTAVREPDSVVAYAPGGAFPVAIESSGGKRFVAQRVGNVRVGIAKTALRIRLALAGQRPISNVVDISNFVMLEVGQPLHFYDYDKLAGHRLIVRDAREGEEVQTLDGIDRVLSARALVIADERQTQCLAGLKGAAASEVGPHTHEIVIEAATFSGPRVRRMGTELALRSDASARHEKALPLALADIGAARAAKLLAEEGATVYAPHGYGQPVPAPAIIALRKREVPRLLGYELPDAEVARLLESLGFSVRESKVRHDGTFEVEVPIWRSDVTIEADLVEEIARLAGYDRVAAVTPPTGQQAIASDVYEAQKRAAHALALLGYREVVTLALQPASVAERWGAKAVEILNPLSEDQHFMRFSLIPGLLELRQDKIFEIGDVFGEAGEVIEKTHAVFLRRTTAPQGQTWSDQQFVALKDDALAFLRRTTGRLPRVRPAKHPGWHPGICAELFFDDGVTVAIAGALDPRLGVLFEVEARAYVAQVDLAAMPAPVIPRYQTPSRYPSLSRDLALVVDLAVSAQQIETVIGGAVDGLARTIRAFDEYHGPQVGAGKKSLAVRIVMQRDDATMTDAEADTAIEKVLQALKNELGATIRT
ncbi:MAG: phenylalanine--tRNA ligase subunit beta [Candidatus Eremiobacteraeota bacterium]|nr:phenylalanine--tRNA ligase subunit beta [Candidatus Eremiobacteraeota bacterium]